MLLRGWKWSAKDKAAASLGNQKGAVPQGAKIMDRNAKVTLPLKTCGLDYSLRCSTHHAGVIRALLGYSFQGIWQTATTIPVVDPCEVSMAVQQAILVQAYQETNCSIVKA